MPAPPSWVKHYSRMALFDVRSHPPLRAELCSPAAVRQPGYLPARRPLGFASPPRSGFALLVAHTDALAFRHIPNACYVCTIHRIPELRNTSRRILSTERWCYVCTCLTCGFAERLT
jgi:hypothetical protein